MFGRLVRTTMWCIYCGHEWVGKSMYCPKCGLSAEALQERKKTRPEFMAELIVTAAAAAVIFWLAGEG